MKHTFQLQATRNMQGQREGKWNGNGIARKLTIEEKP